MFPAIYFIYVQSEIALIYQQNFAIFLSAYFSVGLTQNKNLQQVVKSFPVKCKKML